MIDFQQVSKRFGGQDVLVDASFRINPGERVGIVGPNGAGKTTVFSLIAGELSPDKGTVAIPRNCRLGYLRQQLEAQEVDGSILEYAESGVPDLINLQHRIEVLENELESSAAASSDPLLRELGDLQTRFEDLGGYRIRSRAEAALTALGFAPDALHTPFKALSGGWQMRAELVRVTVAQPEILLMDEPTNYLDIPAVEWLQRFLRDFPGTLAIISHDRYLLNSLTAVTIEIANATATRYGGNYDHYVRDRKLRYEHVLAARRNQAVKREKIERFVERFRAKNTKATQVQSKVKMLERMEVVELPRDVVSPGRIRLPEPERCGHEVVRLEDAGLTYDGARWVLRHVNLGIERGDRVALVGLNGLGKTTLLRILSGRLDPTEGRCVLGHKVTAGYQSQEFAETMSGGRTVMETVKQSGANASEQQVRDLLGGFGFPGEAIDKPVDVLSGGEKIRLAFARLLVNPPNFLLLDEPTTHLDIQARESLEQALVEFSGTLCVVSHDIEFVRHAASTIIAMTPPGITRYWGGYDYYHEKLEQQAVAGSEKAAPVAKGGEGRPSSLPPPSTALKQDKKDLRKQRARERQARHERTRHLKKAIRKAESEVERLEAEKTALTAQLAVPAENMEPPSRGSCGAANYASVNRRFKEIQYEIEIATGEWEKATEELQKAMEGAGEEQKGGETEC